MQILVNSDNHVTGSAELSRYVEATVEDALGRFGDQVTRVEVHVNDVNSDKKKGDNDKRCLMEARLGGLQPIVAQHTGATLEQAIDGAAVKLQNTLEHHLGRLGNKKGRTPYGGEELG